ncbi:hypothetical protein [Acidithiobacillus sp.]|jgi:hypothetical protein|uniref:hypothetical protein n=1 Tax=Acidithiobacillus sp. TaxID=1872118 RepID=UPI0025BCCE6E|nr:hypothetical protein [Acidithiobacillus sp.]MCK9188132.1 hypothetical protein [Acidithiobacillus sp.]MCK9360344.1 hypothetical protein [Acidithiobacillus sp.]
MKDLILYTTEDGRSQIKLRAQEQTVWLSQLEMAALFDATKQSISLHVKNVFEDGALVADSVVNQWLTTAAQGEGCRLAHHNRCAMWPFPILYALCRELPSPTRFVNCQGGLASSKCKRLLGKWLVGNRFAARCVANFTVAAHEAIIAYRTVTGPIRDALRRELSWSHYSLLWAQEQTVWLTQLEMAELFDATKQNISLHLKTICEGGELHEVSVVKESFTTAADGNLSGIPTGSQNTKQWRPCHG